MSWTVIVDGSNITPLCQNINWHPRWSRPATCVVTYPGHLFSAPAGARMLLYNNATLVFAGTVWHPESTGGPNRTDAELTAYDDLIYMTKRLCKQGENDPSPFNLIEIWPTIDTNINAPDIMTAFVQSALDDPNALATAAPLPWVMGSTEFSDVDVTGMPMNTPMTLDQMRQLLQSTGQLVINVTPGVTASTLDFAVPPSIAGGSVATFEYQTGSFNSQNANVNDDMDVIVNALWYLLGPRGPRPGIKINHWGGSITPTAANAGGDGAGGIPGTPWPPALITKFMGSRAQYGYFQEIRIFDEHQDAQSIRELYEEQWANEAWLRAYPRRFVNVTPERGVDPTFTVGDFVTMSAGSRLSGGFSGQVVVYEFEVQINVNGVAAITEIIASDDGTGAQSVGGS